MDADPGEVTRLLIEVRGGSKAAQDRLLDVVYPEVRRLAASYMRKESFDHSLQPTALVHEAYLRLTHLENVDWQCRSHFFSVAAKAMRNILVDHARRKDADKRGEAWRMVGLEEALFAAPSRPPDILALDDALDRLAELHPRKSRVVELRFFGGLSQDETGMILGVDARTVKRDWRFAKAWLYKELTQTGNADYEASPSEDEFAQ
jgi:RNA polymerase sigma-70 factor (ECF subfamily)